MGVSGSGKTTVAALLAKTLGWQFPEGDALHPPANVEKMRGARRGRLGGDDSAALRARPSKPSVGEPA